MKTDCIQRLVFVLAGSCGAAELPAQTWVETGQIPPAPGTAFDVGLAIDGIRLVRGGHTQSANKKVFAVFEWNGTTWSQTAQEQGPQNQSSFGASFSVYGDTLLVGDPSDDGAVGTGVEPAVYQYEQQGINWVLKHKVAYAGGGAGDAFGAHVLLVGDEAFVTAHSLGAQQGAVFVYARDMNGLFQQTQQLSPESSSSVQGMGWSGIAVDGETLVASGFGRFFIFEKQKGAWVRTASFSKEPGLGYAVAAAGGRVFVSDKASPINADVIVYERVDAIWTQASTIVAPPLSQGFGQALFAIGDELVVSATNLSQYGALHIFKESQGQWVEQQKLEADSPNTYFGSTFARSENRIAVADSQNLTHIFERCDSVPQKLAYGAGKPGFYGIPQLQSDLPRLGTTANLTLTNAFPGLGVLFVGFQPATYSFDGGSLLVEPFTTLTFLVPFGGGPTIPVPIPVSAALCGFDVYFQAYVVDATATGVYHTAQTAGLHWIIGA